MYNTINLRYVYNGEVYKIELQKYFEPVNGKVAYVNESFSAVVVWDSLYWIIDITIGLQQAIYKNTTDSEYPDFAQWTFFYSGGLVLDAVSTFFNVHTNILASGVSDVEHIAAFDAMVEQRFANLDIEAVLIYLIDTVNASALPSLAAQFDVLGYKGYGLAQTEQQKRDVIKRAIELHRYKGTPWSIKEALRAIGYYDATIEERLINPIYYDGTYNHNGSQFYGPGHWADFRVRIDIGNDMGVTAQSASDAVKLILEYKNVRSRLRDVSYQSTLVEYVTDTAEEFMLDVEIVSSDAVGYYYDNTYLYSGSVTYGTINENITT